MLKKLITKSLAFAAVFILLDANTAMAQSGNVDAKIAEVYGSTPMTAEQKQNLIAQMERCSIQEMAYSTEEAFPKFSSLPVIDKYVPGIQRDVVTDPYSINPLKYAVNFYENKDLYYRIDGTNFVFVIKKKSN